MNHEGLKYIEKVHWMFLKNINLGKCLLNEGYCNIGPAGMKSLASINL